MWAALGRWCLVLLVREPSHPRTEAVDFLSIWCWPFFVRGVTAKKELAFALLMGARRRGLRPWLGCWAPRIR